MGRITQVDRFGYASYAINRRSNLELEARTTMAIVLKPDLWTGLRNLNVKEVSAKASFFKLSGADLFGSF
jgi:hypothetical protein